MKTPPTPEVLRALTEAAANILDEVFRGLNTVTLDQAVTITQPLPESPVDECDVQYALPGSPPTGRTVTNGVYKWKQHSPGAWSRSAPDESDDDPETMPWHTLLLIYGPVHLVPYTEQEEHENALYGPPDGRWGDPRQNCPTPGCRHGLHHAFPHIDNQNQIITTNPIPAAADLRPDLQLICNCGSPHAHGPECPRNPFNRNDYQDEPPF